jgi:hypothetical protein
VGTGAWSDQGWCDLDARLVVRAEQQAVTIQMENTWEEFGRTRTPFFELRPYNDIFHTVDGAAVSGPDLYNELVPWLGPLVRFVLTIDNPP